MKNQIMLVSENETICIKKQNKYFIVYENGKIMLTTKNKQTAKSCFSLLKAFQEFINKEQ